MVKPFMRHKNRNSWVKVWFERLGVSGVAVRNLKLKVGKVLNLGV